ncbi:hypothetical protein PF005_g24543 [Phytophthora fragariae]|uniref:Secreted protein n=1 Tax=Phytophthora fragariae TaxID=53985 RepID=A0A6A3RL77_9STRA|nr:hypothetical protein PF010_g24063 [Phytophthora fragariae]KAE9096051.1 hypothetical protein PF006_g23865 [Phytophthora fragariae]KAE9177334.1 hypothetical protein PF005_g24543 [Phytophthora fragariae]
MCLAETLRLCLLRASLTRAQIPTAVFAAHALHHSVFNTPRVCTLGSSSMSDAEILVVCAFDAASNGALLPSTMFETEAVGFGHPVTVWFRAPLPSVCVALPPAQRMLVATCKFTPPASAMRNAQPVRHNVFDATFVLTTSPSAVRTTEASFLSLSAAP